MKPKKCYMCDMYKTNTYLDVRVDKQICSNCSNEMEKQLTVIKNNNVIVDEENKKILDEISLINKIELNMYAVFFNGDGIISTMIFDKFKVNFVAEIANNKIVYSEFITYINDKEVASFDSVNILIALKKLNTNFITSNYETIYKGIEIDEKMRLEDRYLLKNIFVLLFFENIYNIYQDENLQKDFEELTPLIKDEFEYLLSTHIHYIEVFDEL